MVAFKWNKKLHKILFSTIFLFGFFIKRRLLYTFFHMFMKKENKIKWLASAHYHDQIEFYFVNKLGRLNIITKFIASTKKFQAILNYFHSHQIQKFTLYCKPVSESIEKKHERKNNNNNNNTQGNKKMKWRNRKISHSHFIFVKESFSQESLVSK